MTTPWERIAENFRIYLEKSGYSADDFNNPSFDRARAFNNFEDYVDRRQQQQPQHQQRQQEDAEQLYDQTHMGAREGLSIQQQEQREQRKRSLDVPDPDRLAPKVYTDPLPKFRVSSSKKRKVEEVDISELVERGICYSFEECPEPVYPRKDPKPFVCGKSWLKEVREVIQSNLDKAEEGGAADDDRIPPLCLARCSRGGKTRSLFSVVDTSLTNDEKEGGSFDSKSLLVSFNDSSDARAEEQDNPLAALTRRIAFAAYTGEKTTENFNNIFRPMVVSDESVRKWLGQTRFVLLIDELNNLENLANPTAESKNAMQKFVHFLKDNFLKKAGRYFVFTTHEVFIKTEFSILMDAKSNRKFVHCSLPLIPSLIAAQNAFGWKDLNARDAIYCGLIPGLILMKGKFTFPTEKREAAVSAFLNTNYREETVLSLLKSLVTGEKESVPDSLEQLMDTSDEGKIRWVPDHMAYVLGQIADRGFEKLSNKLRILVQKIVDLFGQFQGAKTYGGDGWEALFGLVLLVRILTKQSNHLIDLTTFLSTNIEFTTSFNQPITVTADNQFDDFQDADALMAVIPKKQKGANVAIYYPSHASFKQYDMLVVMWDAAGNQFKTIGYQLKEGKEIPSDKARSGFQNFVVRGKAAQKSKKLRNWEIPSDNQIDNFFGSSGVHWTPKRWGKLKVSACLAEQG